MDDSSQQEGPVLLGSDSLDRLALNDSRLNDSVTVSVYEEENWSFLCHVELEVTLDGTETLTWELSRDERIVPTLLAARLTDPDRDAIVLEPDAVDSTYGGAMYCVMEVIDGALTGTMLLGYDDDGLWLEGAKIIDLDYNLLQALRLPNLVDKWHNPEWYTVEWNGVDWNRYSDGYFTD